MALIPGFTPLQGRRFIDTASLLITAKVDITIDAETFGQVDALVQHIARDIQAQMLRSFKSPKSGRVYEVDPNAIFIGPRRKGARKRKTVKWRASAPGEPPAVRLGYLSRSVFNGLTFPAKGEAELTIDTGYETFLELGTRRMRARPYVFPAIKDVLSKLYQSDVISNYSIPTRVNV